MYKEQLEERHTYKYPPFHRLIKITLKHRDYQKIEESSQWLTQSLRNVLGVSKVLGPETPPVARIRNLYHKHIMIKIGPKQSLQAVKKDILRVQLSFKAIAPYRSVRLILDVDTYA